LPLSGLVADGAYLGAAKSGARVPIGVIAIAAVAAPALLVLAAGCGLIVARGWTGAVWAVASAGSGGQAGLRDALSWSRRRSRLLWGIYLAGLAVLVGLAFLAGYVAPGAATLRNVLVLAGPAGLLAPVLSLAPATAYRRASPTSADPPAVSPAPAVTRRRAHLAPLAFVLAGVVGCEVAVALVLSRLMTPASAADPSISGAAAALIASLVALPGSVVLIAASAVSYAGLRGRAERLTQQP
jgi:hypothetical protein